MNTQAVLVVRADVPNEADRRAFDRWYDDPHLTDALRVFGAVRAWRAWSLTDPSKHIAFYEFSSLEAANGATGSSGAKELIAGFDAVWGSRVTRSREILEIAQRLPNAN